MLTSNSNEEEKIVIVKKLEGPSVEEEYAVNHEDTSYSEDVSYYSNKEISETDETPPKSKIKIILPLIALLVGGGAFYFMQSKDTCEKVVTPSTVETTKELEPLSLKQPIEEKVVLKKEEEHPPPIVEKSESKVEKEAPTHYIEALAMPTVVEKEEKKTPIIVQKSEPKVEEKAPVIEKKSKPKAEQYVPLNYVEIVNVPTVVKEEKKLEKSVVTQELKNYFIEKRAPSLVPHYERIKPRIIRVRRGDTLMILAKRFYGNEGAYRKIVRANRRIRSSRTALHLGEKLVIPRKDNKTTRRYVIIEKGNSLAMIAKKFYGDEKAISKIIRANYRIKSRRSMLHVGQKVYVPR